MEMPPAGIGSAQWIAIAIFAGVYLVLAVGRLPKFRVDRTGAAIIGASLMVGLNVLTFDEAYRAIDYETIVLLFGMMVVVANLRLSGFFSLVSSWVVDHAHRPLALLGAIVMVSGVLSAFFVNDTVCVVLTPLVLEVAIAVRRNPVPYLLAVAMASNAGSVATITGNPQNMMIGSFSGIGYQEFLWELGPVAAASVAIVFLVLAFVYRQEFRNEQRVEFARHRVYLRKPLLWKSGTAAVGMTVFFFAGWPVAKVAVLAAAFVLLTRRVKPQRIYREIDWGLLVMFVGLFIVVAGMEKAVLGEDARSAVARLPLANPWLLTAVTAALSNLVSNVPAVMLFRPIVSHLPDPVSSWLVLAMASTLAGNLTLLGSVANLIVVEQARRKVAIPFWEYGKAGVLVGILTLALGAWMLS